MSKAPEYNPIRKLADNPSSKAQAIKAMCAHCMGCTADSVEPGFRQSIFACTTTTCPLYSVRPYRAKPAPEGHSSDSPATGGDTCND